MKLKPLYNGPFIVISQSVCALVALFLYILKILINSLFSKAERFHVKIIQVLFACKENFLEKYNKTSSKIYKSLAQEEVP